MGVVLLEEGASASFLSGVEPVEGFIEEDDAWTAHQCTREAGESTLTAREGVGERAGSRDEVERSEDILEAFANEVGVSASEFEWQRHVLDQGEVCHQARFLEDDANPLPVHLQDSPGQAVNLHVVDEHAPRLAPSLAAEELEEEGFAAATGADDAHDFTRGNLEVETREDGDGDAARPNLDLLQLDHRHPCYHGGGEVPWTIRHMWYDAHRPPCP
jgi:hypothetical protein